MINKSNVKRELNPMPEFILKSLKENRLYKAYLERPGYQRNDYVGWIKRAQKKETKIKRLSQMLAELKSGNIYMNMIYKTKLK